VVAGLLIGVIALIAGMFMAEPSRIWSAILLNTFFVFSIALGASAFGAMQDVVGAVWGRPIKRILEAISAFVPVAGGILLFFVICLLLDVLHARDVYVWMKDPHMLDHF